MTKFWYDKGKNARAQHPWTMEAAPFLVVAAQQQQLSDLNYLTKKGTLEHMQI